jgi:hypothetical protein
VPSLTPGQGRGGHRGGDRSWARLSMTSRMRGLSGKVGYITAVEPGAGRDFPSLV